MNQGIAGQCQTGFRTWFIPLAKSIAFEFGQASKRADLFVTLESMELIGLCILGAASQTAHQVLVNQDVLMADTTVKKWVLS